jgi:hypothetical protein
MSWLITGSQPVPVDPFRSQASLLLHGNGTNGSTTVITDSSGYAKDCDGCGQCADQYRAEQVRRGQYCV